MSYFASFRGDSSGIGQVSVADAAVHSAGRYEIRRKFCWLHNWLLGNCVLTVLLVARETCNRSNLLPHTDRLVGSVPPTIRHWFGFSLSENELVGWFFRFKCG